jgi:hypothetical protein
MPENHIDQTLDSLSEWSKWITGISLFSASGCVSVLVTKGVGEKNIVNIKLAILFFLFTVVIAWILQLVIAERKQRDTIPAERLVIFSYNILNPLLRTLVFLQILLFLLSVFYLARWVWKFPAVKPVQQVLSVIYDAEQINAVTEPKKTQDVVYLYPGDFH